METYSDLSAGELLDCHTPGDILKMSGLEFAQYEQLDAIRGVVTSMEEYLQKHPGQNDEFEALRDMAEELITMFSG
jgi:hypothetical protein